DERFFLFWHDYQPHYPYEPPMEYDVFSYENYSGIVNTRPTRDDPVCKGISNSVEKDWCNTKTGYYFNLILENLTDKDFAHVKAMYDGEILAVNAKFSRLVNLLGEKGILDKTIIVFTSDHGESFAERDSHKRIGHTLMYEEVLRVPLIIKAPSLTKQVRVEPVVESIDIMPTILDLLGITVPEGLDGESLLDKTGDFSAYSENFGEGGDMEDYSIRNENLKLIFYKRMMDPEFRERREKDEYELYDLSQDAREQKNIYGLNTSPEIQMRDMLYDRIQDNKTITEKTELDAETIKRLQDLGYLAGKHA
ncbi:MAG: sulfatase-like hydrolase/transferase, partial [Methanobacteriota archaeon]